MKISMQLTPLSVRYGIIDAVKMVSQAGFDGIDFSFFGLNNEDGEKLFSPCRLDYINEINAVLKECGLSCFMAHAHFPSEKPDDDAYNSESFEKLLTEMETAALLGAKAIVVHPVKGFADRSKALPYNIAYYNKLLPYCKKFGIKVALENMFLLEPHQSRFSLNLVASACGYGAEFAEYLEHLDKEWFTACLDTGHSAVLGEEPHYAVRALGKEKLKFLHVQDNDFLHDSHTVPYFGKIDWEEFCKALAEIDYDGVLNFETHHFLDGIPDGLYMDALRFMRAVAVYLAQKTENYRSGAEK